MKTLKILLIPFVLLLSSGAYAVPISPGLTYNLENHPDGGARPPLYGLRLDGLIGGDRNDIYTFDFRSMTLIWDDLGDADGTNDTITIAGQVFGGLNAGTGYDATKSGTWNVSFVYTGVNSCYGDGLCADVGIGSITSLNGLGTFDLEAYMGSHDFAFQLNYNHRGFDGVSGWGWVNHCTPALELTCPHLPASDWLFALSVPEPGTLALLGIGLLGMGLSRRRRQ